MKKIVFLSCFMFSCFVGAYAEDTVKINGNAVEHGQTVYLYKKDLQQGSFIISIDSDRQLLSAEASLDRGRTWNEMMIKEDGSYILSHRPLNDKDYIVSFLLKELNTAKILSTNIKIKYSKAEPADAIIALLEKMKRFYETENISQFVSILSSRFSNGIEFREAIQKDSYNYNNIRLNYRVERKTFSPDGKSGIWDVYWQRKYDDRSTTNNSDNSTISMFFVKEGAFWKIGGMNNNALFGSSLGGATTSTAPKPDLTANPSDITNVGFSVNATIRNTGNAASDSFEVAFYSKIAVAPDVLEGTQIVVSLAPGAQTVVTQGFSVSSGTHTVRISIDSASDVDESSEANNSVSQVIMF